MFSRVLNNITLFGGGLGSEGHSMIYLYSKSSVADCDYLRILSEYGVIGAIILGGVIVLTIMKGLRNLRRNWFYLSSLAFLLVSMLGAAPLELYSLEPYMYWYCMGRINTNQTFDIRKYANKIHRANNPQL